LNAESVVTFSLGQGPAPPNSADTRFRWLGALALASVRAVGADRNPALPCVAASWTKLRCPRSQPGARPARTRVHFHFTPTSASLACRFRRCRSVSRAGGLPGNDDRVRADCLDHGRASEGNATSDASVPDRRPGASEFRNAIGREDGNVNGKHGAPECGERCNVQPPHRVGPDSDRLSPRRETGPAPENANEEPISAAAGRTGQRP
jgi:hypothetical protein